MIRESEVWISGRYRNMTVAELFNTIYTQYYAKSFLPTYSKNQEVIFKDNFKLLKTGDPEGK